MEMAAGSVSTTVAARDVDVTYVVWLVMLVASVTANDGQMIVE